MKQIRKDRFIDEISFEIGRSSTGNIILKPFKNRPVKTTGIIRDRV